MKRLFVFVMGLSLVACGSDNVIYRDRIVHVNVPVVQPCASTRPEEPKPLNEVFTNDQWNDMDIVQKTGHVGTSALLKDQYAKDLNAATGACPTIE